MDTIINFRGVAVIDTFFSEGNITSEWEIQSSCFGTEPSILNCKVSKVQWWETDHCNPNLGVICGEPGILSLLSIIIY